MKKILYLLLCLAVFIGIFTVPCFAEEVSAVSEEETETVFTRLWEWILINKETVLSVAGEAVLLLLMVKNWFKQKNLGYSLDNVKVSSATTVANQKAVVEKMDEMISEFNENKVISEKLEVAEEHIEKMVETVSEMMLSLFEMMTMIHTQNRNLPQGTKDRVTQIFADCMKKVEEHDALGLLSSGLQSSIDIITKENADDKQNEGQGA